MYNMYAWLVALLTMGLVGQCLGQSGCEDVQSGCEDFITSGQYTLRQ